MVRQTPANSWQAPAGRLWEGPLAVRVIGHGPPVVLMHGLLGSNRYWGQTYNSLADHHTVLAPDLLGFGRSPRPLRGHGPGEHLDALSRSVRELVGDQKATVVGHSLGALLAIGMASEHADQVGRVVAIAPPLFRDPTHARQHIGHLGPLERLFATDSRLAELACRQLCGRRPRLAARLYSTLRRGMPLPVLQDATMHSWESYSETLRRVVLAAVASTWLAAAACEVVLLAGTDDTYLDLEYVRDLTARLPNVTLLTLPGGGHDLPLTEPRACLSIIDAAGARETSHGRGDRI